MNKKITIELTQEEYDSLCKLWEKAKSSPIMPSKSINIDDFCKELIVSSTKMPDFSNMEELMNSFGDLSNLDNLKEALSGMVKKPETKKPEEKKDVTPDDQKYKS